MSVGIYSIGCLFLLAGVSYLAHLMQLSMVYVVVAALFLVCVGFGTTFQNARSSRSGSL